ncbi:MAG TPA: DNA methyltransferase [Candidatus Diapherotrites archaeon]|nr:DNA methyltransferase [Candidatus Diapherotrites archaeon]
MEAIKNKIICGDVVAELRKIPDKSIDLIFADPPYFMQTEGELIRVEGTKFNGVEDKWDKFKSYKEYDVFCQDWLSECKRILKDNGTIWVIGSFQNIYRIGYIMQNLGFWILNDIVWSKPNPVPNFRGVRFTNAHETMLWCSKSKKSKYTFNYKTMKYLNNNKQEKSVWEIGICIGNERIKGKDGKKAHSTQKPEKLLRKVILSSSNVNDIVLDPFMGTGTTGAVAKELNRNYIGIDNNPEYVRIATNRIDKVKESNKINEMMLDKKITPVPMKKLMAKGYIKQGQKLYNKEMNISVTITNDGLVEDKNDKLSIHKMSAKYLKTSNNNGWDYWYVDKNKPLDDLRKKYRKEILNE